MPKKRSTKSTRRKKRKPTRWNKHVMAVYRKNKAAGFSAAMSRAKKTTASNK